MVLTIRATKPEKQRNTRRCSPHPGPKTESAAGRAKTETKMRRYMAGLAALSSGLQLTENSVVLLEISGSADRIRTSPLPVNRNMKETSS